MQLSLDLVRLDDLPENLVLVGDKAYDSDPLDAEVKKRSVEMIAPHRGNDLTHQLVSGKSTGHSTTPLDSRHSTRFSRCSSTTGLDHGPMARTADRAVLIRLRRFLAGIRVPSQGIVRQAPLNQPS